MDAQYLKPDKKFHRIIEKGVEAHRLATEHQLGERLPAGQMDGLAADVATLGSLVPGTEQRKGVGLGATETERSAIRRGADLVSAIRSVLAQAEVSADVRRAYGVGVNYNPRIIKGVVAAMDLVLDRVRKSPEEARSLGILESDIETLRATRSAILSADEGQAQEKAKSGSTIRERNQAAHRIQGAVGRIAAAGSLKYPSDPRRSLFVALLGKGRGVRKPKEEAAQSETPKAA